MVVRITNWYQVIAYTVAMTVLVTLISIGVVAVVYRNSTIEEILPTYELATFIPFLISIPASLFSFYVLMTLHETVMRVDELMKYDALTGLLARSRFLHIAEETRHDGGFLIIADADRFKSINDTYGHGVGDAALKHIASTMMQVLGPYGAISRIGGEEFALRLPKLSRKQLELLLHTLGTKLRNEGFKVESHYLMLTLSLGVVQVDSSLPIATLLRTADRALYLAKERGRDQFVFAEELDTVSVDAA